jgi:hypothetical protein
MAPISTPRTAAQPLPLSQTRRAAIAWRHLLARPSAEPEDGPLGWYASSVDLRRGADVVEIFTDLPAEPAWAAQPVAG